MKTLAQITEGILEKDLLPDSIIRIGIRGLLGGKLNGERKKDQQFGKNRITNFVEELKQSPIAVNTLDANQQHYELPTEFFKLVMGKHMKYSCGLWEEGVTDFDQSERDMLELTIRRADLTDGQDVLELGCGWGSLSLYMAEKFPNSRFTGVSNSRTQKQYIDGQAQQRGLTNLTIITKDMNEFTINQTFDRVVSVEMFEHMRNYQKLLEKISGFLNPGGKLFVHIFTHKDYAYTYEVDGGFDWMARYFFTGGIMPSDDLLLYFQDHFKIEEHWQVNGVHYQKTSEEWLKNMYKNKDKIIPILKKTYGEDQYKKWWVYWRVFFMSCAELWGYKKGTEWIVSHYRFNKK
jgi:cyclopropane-fatty-acyl-phospholipid synthase